MLTRKTLMSFLTVVLLGVSPIVVTVPAYAATSTTNAPTNFFSELVQFLSTTFHLDQGQVQNAVNTFASQHKAEMQQKMQDKEKTHLDSLVKQGKITSAQEQQILLEQAKLQSEYNPASFKNLTPDQRKAKLQQEQAEIQAWSQATGIDAKYLRPGFGRMRLFNRWNNHAAPTPTPQV